ncbi:hypothetical protein HPB48_019594 [Haemaphysalis longicornis]|uniref:Uncharacterized protein n=1 Tax=Haemaphysalis longicornis TaxID=44386 RepID=A0A9J6FF84_HAELO|nr:hypothetical protein HPB48_019594 [Haemaphysalis longicornis]
MLQESPGSLAASFHLRAWHGAFLSMKNEAALPPARPVFFKAAPLRPPRSALMGRVMHAPREPANALTRLHTPSARRTARGSLSFQSPCRRRCHWLPEAESAELPSSARELVSPANLSGAQ